MDEDLASLREARFGMFVHWGLYAQLGGRWKGETMAGPEAASAADRFGEWAQSYFMIPTAEYAPLAKSFDPVLFDADDWVRRAKDAGIEYVVLTTKHHEGFSMFATKASDYNVVDATPFGRDVFGELAAACRRAGLRVGAYYSQNLDWHEPDAGDPDWAEFGLVKGERHWGNCWEFRDHAKKDFSRYFRQKVFPQVEELLTNYGDIFLVWFDTPRGMAADQSRALREHVRRLSPHTLVNSRIGNGCGDYKSMGDNEPVTNRSEVVCESAMTLNDTWGFRYDDHRWKSAYDVAVILAQNFSQGANVLLNVGPRPDGRFPDATCDILSDLGAWRRRTGFAIRGVRASPFKEDFPWGWCMIAPGNVLQLVIRREWTGDIVLKGVAARVVSAPEGVRLSGDVLTVTPPAAPDLMPRVVRVALDSSTSAEIVADPRRATPHPAVTVMGRDYWTLLNSGPFSDPARPLTGVNAGTGLEDLAMFRDAALVYPVGGQPPPDPELATWRTMEECYPGGTNDATYVAMKANAKPEVPIFTRFSHKRLSNTLQGLEGRLDLDHASFDAWRGQFPNLVGLVMADEWGNEIATARWRVRNYGTPERRERIVRDYFSFPMTRAGCNARARKIFDRLVDLYYGRRELCAAMRGMYGLDHAAAAWGARQIGLETTSTSGDGESEYEEWRWEVASMFTRGASRQFNVPWCWFVAIYMNGYTQDGNLAHNSVCWYPPRPSPRRLACPEGGISASLFNRVCYYAYLNGATYVEPEGWMEHLTTTNVVGKRCLSPRGELFSAYHDFTKRHPGRGIPYAPVAILTPFDQGYPMCGGWSWRSPSVGYSNGDYMVDGVFYTIVPGFNRPKALREGREHCLHNTPNAMMYDVLVPDSPQPQAEFERVLSRYSAAILAGDYPSADDFAPALARYVQAGGTLLVPPANLPEGVLPKGLSGRPLVDGCGFSRGTEYTVGKGRVLVSLSPWMTPPLAGDRNKAVIDVFAGRRAFPEIAYFLRRFQKEFFPFNVSGDCLYGANKTERGWWLWMFNNNGVTKFADAYERMDASAVSELEVEVPDGTVVRELRTESDVVVRNGRFQWTLSPGDVAIFEVDAISKRQKGNNKTGGDANAD